MSESGLREPADGPVHPAPASAPDAPDGADGPPPVPTGRYGPERTPARRRAAVLGVAVLAAAGIALVLWLGLRAAGTPVRWNDVGFAVDGPTAVELTFEVITDPGTSVDCRVHALSESYAEVGVRTVQVGPAQARTQRVTVTIPTAELAVTALVERCDVADG